MRSYRCLFLWLCVLLWYASTPAIAQIWREVKPSPPDSVGGYEQRVGVRFGVAGVVGKSPFFLGFVSGQGANQININFEYGRRYGQWEWDVHARLTQQLFDTIAIAKTLNLYDSNIDRTARIGLRADKRTVDGLMLGVGGKLFLGKPESNKVVFFLRGYTGLHFLTHNDFTITVNNRSAPRTDTTAQVNGASTLLGYLGLNPGLEFRSGPIGLSVEFLGLQFYTSNAMVFHIFKIGTSIFFLNNY
jgi:hypothetical protein